MTTLRTTNCLVFFILFGLLGSPCSPRCPHCSGDMCKDGTRAPTTPRAAPRAWEVPPLMGREINFPPGEWPPPSRSSPTQTRAGRRPARRAAPAPPSRDEPPPGRPQKRRRHNWLCWIRPYSTPSACICGLLVW